MKNKFQFSDIETLKRFLSSCLDGDSTSIMQFQETFGEDIYNFPVKVRRVDKDKAADFYCYCFEKSRIFKRLLTYKGICSVRTYQYYVLNDLYNEWKRAESFHNLPMGSLNAPVNPDSEEEMIDFVKDYDTSYTMIFNIESISLNFFDKILRQLSDEERIYLKLLTYHEFGLDIDDLRIISRISGKPLNEVIDSFNEIDRRLSEKDEDYAERLSKLDEIEVRILNLEKDLKTLRQESIRKNDNLNDEINDLERKLEWRHSQKKKLIQQYKKTTVKLSYRDIASLLSVSVGIVSTRINEIKGKFLKLYNEVRQ